MKTIFYCELLTHLTQIVISDPTPDPSPNSRRGGEQADSCLRPPLNSGEGGERSERGGGQTDTLRKVNCKLSTQNKDNWVGFAGVSFAGGGASCPASGGGFAP